MCSNETLMPHHKRCKSDEEITNFVKRITIDSWSNYETIMMTNHVDRPTVRIEKWISQDLLDPYTIKQNFIKIKQ